MRVGRERRAAHEVRTPFGDGILNAKGIDLRRLTASECFFLGIREPCYCPASEQVLTGGQPHIHQSRDAVTESDEDLARLEDRTNRLLKAVVMAKCVNRGLSTTLHHRVRAGQVDVGKLPR